MIDNFYLVTAKIVKSDNFNLFKAYWCGMYFWKIWLRKIKLKRSFKKFLRVGSIFLLRLKKVFKFLNFQIIIDFSSLNEIEMSYFRRNLNFSYLKFLN